MTRALVTGVTGQDGYLLAAQLLGESCEVHGLARRVDADVPPGVRVLVGDLLDAESLRRAVAEVRPDELYHLAAPTYVPDSLREPERTRREIVDATEVLLDAAPDGARVFCASSAEIFGEAAESPQNEESVRRPRNPYGEAKLAALEAVAQARSRGVHAVAGILYNHESTRRPERFVPRRVSVGTAMIKLGLADELTLGDLEAVRDWSAATDLMRGATLALRHDTPDDYVLASGVGRTVQELVDVAFAHVGIDPAGRVRIDPQFTRGVEEVPLVGDPSKARRVLGFQPQVSFEELIGEMVDFDLERLGDG
ncbi:MAG TPA: GDP-mannose 4,6-dehydratase [Solirubrobacteraceae bacterium]|nr:GDP-mannose 4,6-dehydratase [Solirubrobacteraceae bacterium]